MSVPKNYSVPENCRGGVIAEEYAGEIASGLSWTVLHKHMY